MLCFIGLQRSGNNMSATVTTKVVYQLARATGEEYTRVYIYSYIQKPIGWFSRSDDPDT